MSFEILAVLTL